MQFNSYIFIFAFLPACLAGYFGLQHFGMRRAAVGFLSAASLLFFAFAEPRYLVILLFSAVFNWAISRFILKRKEEKILLFIGILVNLGFLFYFKYYDFFIDNVNLIFGSSFATINVIMPLGISFFTFQQIAWLVDSYHGETEGENFTFLNYLLYTVYFPKISMGPILLHDDFFPQLADEERKHINVKNLSQGLMMLSVGLFKKVILAEFFAGPVNWGYSNIDMLSFCDAILVMTGYMFELYFDFSGYCDMACGISKMFSIDLPQNFNSPLKALSPVDFWRRWHMTLTRFLQKYVYFPLGGSKKGTLRTYFNIMIVFITSGLWHGANWTYVVWGALHGAGQVFTRAVSKYWDKLCSLIRWAITYIYINITFVFFRADSISDAAAFLKRLFNPQGIMPSVDLLVNYNMVEFTSLFNGHRRLCVLVCYAFALFIVTCTKNLWEEKLEPTPIRCVLTVLLLVWSLISFMGVSTFIYFQF